MQYHTDKVGVGIASFGDIGSHLFAIDVIDHHIALNAYAISAIGVAHDSHFHAIYIYYVRTSLSSSFGVEIRSGMRHAYFVEVGDGAFQTSIASVEAVIIGSDYEVETVALQLVGEIVGGAEARVTRIGFSAQRTFEVNYSIVGASDVVSEKR